MTLQCPLGKCQTPPIDTKAIKRDGWREQGVLAVAIDDHRLTWPERELVRQLGEKLYGTAIGGRAVQR